MREFNSNEIATDFGMRDLSPGEEGCYLGTTGKALLADVELLGDIGADLIIDDATLQLHFADEHDETRTWEWNGPKTSRFERELMAALVVTMAHRPDGLELHDLVCLGWEWIA
jgi:hypothetical protein